MLPVTSHRSVQKLDVWHRSNPRADSCLFTPLRRAVHGIMPRINFLKTTGTGDLGRGRRGGGGGGGGGMGLGRTSRASEGTVQSTVGPVGQEP